MYESIDAYLHTSNFGEPLQQANNGRVAVNVLHYGVPITRRKAPQFMHAHAINHISSFGEALNSIFFVMPFVFVLNM